SSGPVSSKLLGAEKPDFELFIEWVAQNPAFDHEVVTCEVKSASNLEFNRPFRCSKSGFISLDNDLRNMLKYSSVLQ
ncbi:hypothetical protein LBW89_22475, partial [Paenibacillus sp. alder61]|uniref:hypothetical protein n=1 Tax=Paenibacillus sp. alder61 TaxID=2862948 RepID=UPI001CD2AF2C